MKNFKSRWEITKNWQLLFPLLGILASGASAYFIALPLSLKIVDYGSTIYPVTLLLLVVAITFIIIKFSLWCFKKLKNRWKVNYRWEFIAIFLCFAVTGSSAGKISDPIMSLLQLPKETTRAWVYWPIRVLVLFPVYQVLLVIFGWLFGQHQFFKKFAIRMLSKLGLGFLVQK